MLTHLSHCFQCKGLLQQAIEVLRDHDTPSEVYRWYGLEQQNDNTREATHDPV